MEKINPILKIAKENNGVVTNEQVVNLGLQRLFAKLVTEVILFFLSYFVQHSFIFKGGNDN